MQFYKSAVFACILSSILEYSNVFYAYYTPKACKLLHTTQTNDTKHNFGTDSAKQKLN